MKKYFLLFAIVILCKITIAQCDNNVSTNPSSPTNSALPDIPGNIPFNNFDTGYLNHFDWVNGNAGLPNGEYTLTNMYYNVNQPYGNMANIQDANLTGFYTYLNKHLGAEAMSIINGWELMLVNLGTYPNNTPHNLTTLSNVPYLVFYNKYSGVLRVFVRYGNNEPPNGSINGVKIDLEYQVLPPSNGNISGVLRLGEGRDRALNKSTNVKKMTIIAPKKAQATFWMSADFQLTYDPCVCISPSNMSMTFTFFTQSELKLYGRGLSTNVEDLTAGNELLEKDFLSNIDYSENTANNGFIMYKKMESLINDYVEKLNTYNTTLNNNEKYNALVERNLKIAKAVAKILKYGISAALGTPEIAALQGELGEFFFSDDSDASKDKIKKLFAEMEKFLGVKLDSYIAKNFVTKEAPTKPVMPSATFSEMHFSGLLTQTTTSLGPTFSTPGSFNNNKYTVDLPYQPVYGYPIYNQPSGIFSLLKAPKINISKVSKNFSNSSDNVEIPFNPDNVFLLGGTYDIYTKNYSKQNWVDEYQVQFLEDLKYSFNNYLDIKSYTIEASLVMEPSIEIKRPDNLSEYVLVNSSLDFGKTVNSQIQLTNSNGQPIKELLRGKSATNTNESYMSQILNELNESNTINNEVQKNVKFQDVFQSPFVDVNAVNPLVFSLSIDNEFVRSKIEKKRTEIYYLNNLIGTNYHALSNIPPTSYVYIENDYGTNLIFDSLMLKLKVNVVFNSLNSLGENNTTTLILSYNLDSDDISRNNQIFATNLQGSSVDLTQFPENLYFTNQNFNGSPVKGCKLNGTTYNCQAWKDIKINGNLSSSNGYTVNLIAGNQIETFPESVISPEITFSIVPVLDYSNPMPEATPSYVASFCSKQNPAGENYQADTYIKTALDSLLESQNGSNNPTDLAINKAENELDFQLYPNPSSQLTTVIVEGNESGLATLSVFDVMGKEQNLIIQGQNGQFNFDVSTLAKGMYFVRVNTIGASKTKQLIVK
jgi:hypothetical protein